MNMDLLSVVMSVYNAQNFLSTSIGAILEQSYQNFELILVDDGSTDNSGKICEDYAASDSRITVYHKPNGGHSSAVNYGLDRMHGKYVMICDTDDYYLPGAFEIAVQKMQSSPDCDAVIFAIYRPDREPVEDPASMVPFDKRAIDLSLLSGQTYEYCNIGFHIESTWAKIIRTDVIQKYKVRMPEHLFLDEDAVFCLHLFEHCRKVAFDSHHIYHYEIHFESYCRRYSDVAVHMLPLILEEQGKYVQRYHASDREYISANDAAVFSWFNEAEEHYFFNENQKATFMDIYKQYRQLLLQPTVRKHILDIRLSEIPTNMRKIRYSFYKKPIFVLFLLYYITKVKSRQE